VATGSDHCQRAEELLARDASLTAEMLATAQVHAMLALAAATALADSGRIEADTWCEVAVHQARTLAAGLGWLVFVYCDRPARTARLPVMR
jgi:hypothetical protein